MSEEVLPPPGLIIDYSNMAPVPAITYNTANNTMVFNNPIQTISGSQSSTFNAEAEFKAHVDFNESRSVGYSDIINQWSPMPSPINPSNFFYPEVNVKSSIQTGELMVAKDGVMKFYCGKDIAKFSGSVTCPTINATTTLQVGGAYVNYLFAPLPPVLDNYMLE